MKILITGGGGYLGSMVTAQMLGAGHQVTVVDTFGHGVYSLAIMAANPNLTIVREDCTSLRALNQIKSHDVILPLAAIVGQAACESRQAEALLVNQGAIHDVCRMASPEQVIIFPCTNSGYGIGTDAPCTEESPLRPLSLYGKTKVQAEEDVMKRENSISLRLATLFGWSMRMRRDLLVNDLTWRAHVDRSAVIFEKAARRNFCHVRDAARAFLHALENFSVMRGQIYNVGDTRANMTKLQLCDRISQQRAFRYLAGDFAADPDKRDYVVSNDKIEATGWQPSLTIDQGITELLRGYQMMRGQEHGNC